MELFRSLKARLAVISALVIAVVLVIAGLGLFLLFQSYLDRRVNQELKDRILDLAGTVQVDGAGLFGMSRPPSDPRYKEPYGGAYWYVREGATVVLRSRSLWDSEVALPANPPAVGYFTKATGPENVQVYLMERPITLGEGALEKNYVLGVAIDQTEVQELTSSLGTVMSLALACMGIVLFAGAWLQTSYGLYPLRSVRHQLSELHGGTRTALEGPFPTEIDDLTRELNALFAQQKDLINKARERAGTLAHGLKTPMTILYGEVLKLQRSGEVDAAKRLRHHLNLIQEQIDRELSRARTHGATIGIGLETDVLATAQRVVGLMRHMPRGDMIDWQLPKSGHHNAAIDADDCGELLGNLFDNARKWAKGVVRLELSPEAEGLRVSVQDDGPGIPADLRDAALARGSQVAQGSDGSGLGLAIVKDLLQSYGASPEISQSALGGLAVSFVLKPIAQRA